MRDDSRDQLTHTGCKGGAQAMLHAPPRQAPRLRPTIFRGFYSRICLTLTFCDQCIIMMLDRNAVSIVPMYDYSDNCWVSICVLIMPYVQPHYFRSDVQRPS